MTCAVLSLGSNLGDRLGYLRLAVVRLSDMVEAVSPVYETKPWGVLDQPDFLNAVVLASGDLDAWGWLARARQIESAAHRVRSRKWGPRTLDIDVISVDAVTLTSPELILPHPEAHERATVLVPWLDIDPAAELVGHGKVADLVTGLDQSGMVRRNDFALSVR